MKQIFRDFLFALALVAVAASRCTVAAAASAAGDAGSDSSSAILVRVDQSGKGDFQRIQDAIKAVPSNNTKRVFIWIKPGVYREKVIVPEDKPYITLTGSDASTTIITWDEAWNSEQSPTVSVLASDFVGRYLTIQNTFGSSEQAVALRVAGDRVAFYTCRIIGFQDTLLDDAGRHYYRNCYIEGGTDFICGNAQSLFQKCHLHSISRNGGALTAQRRASAAENTGYSFLQCRITGVGAGTALLGRPWGAYSRVVFAFTYMSDAVLAQGWSDWDDPRNQRSVYYGEYKCFGPGSNSTGRVDWSRKLSLTESAMFMSISWISGPQWLRSPPKHFKKSSALRAISSDDGL